MSTPAAPHDGRPLSPLEEAPATVPRLTVNGVGVPPTQYQWMSDGTWDVVTVDDPDELRIPEVELGAGLRMRVGSRVAPELATVAEYRELDAAGHPVGEAARTLDCLSSDECAISSDDAGLTIDVRAIAPGSIVSLVLVYGRSTGDARRPLVLLSSSWVVRIASRPVRGAG